MGAGDSGSAENAGRLAGPPGGAVPGTALVAPLAPCGPRSPRHRKAPRGLCLPYAVPVGRRAGFLSLATRPASRSRNSAVAGAVLCVVGSSSLSSASSHSTSVACPQL